MRDEWSTFECAVHGPSDHAPSLSATRHLLEPGHRRIAAITGPAHVLSSRARLDGYRAALAARALYLAAHDRTGPARP